MYHLLWLAGCGQGVLQVSVYRLPAAVLRAQFGNAGYW
jgi:uncharacterized lipoprotein YmbA